MSYAQPELTPIPFLGTLKCGSQVDSCKEDAVWHILWRRDPSTNLSYTSLACDRHMNLYQKDCAFLERHAAKINCDMPGSGWAGDHCTI